MCTELPAVLQTNQPAKDENLFERSATSPGCSDVSTRWEEISQKIRINHDLGEERKQQF